MTALMIGLAGVLGALIRFGIDSLFASGGRFAASKPDHFPLATLTVNVVGSYLIGLAGGLAAHAEISADWHSALTVGLAGGLTTFSSFAVATVSLWQQGHRHRAVLNVALNLVLGLSAAFLGLISAA